MKYRTELHTNSEKFDANINELITKGWKPQGGVSMVVINYIIHYAQALVLKEESDV